MDKFSYSYHVGGSAGWSFVKFNRTGAGIEIQCLNDNVECAHLLEPCKYEEFLAKIGQKPGMDVLIAAKAATRKNLRPLVHRAVEELAKVEFVWQSSEQIEEMHEERRRIYLDPAELQSKETIEKAAKKLNGDSQQ